MATVEENTLVEGLERARVHLTTLIIFGATGDLAQRKLLPAVYNLAHEGALPERFNMIGIARTEQPDDDYRAFAREAIQKYSRRQPDETVLSSLLERMRYVPGSFDDSAAHEGLESIANELDEEADVAFNRIFYLATAPGFFETIAEALGQRGLDRREGA